MRLKFVLKANYLAYIEPRWKGSQIFADSQQNLISPKHDYSGRFLLVITGWKVSKYGVISGTSFPAFSPNTGKNGPEITPYLDTFHALSFS